MKYLTIIRNHQTEIESVDKQFNSFENALLHIESYISSYIQERQGTTHFIYSKTPPNIKYGFYVIESSFCEYIIYERIRNIGYLLNSYHDKEYFTISICRSQEFGQNSLGTKYTGEEFENDAREKKHLFLNSVKNFIFVE